MISGSIYACGFYALLDVFYIDDSKHMQPSITSGDRGSSAELR